MRAAYTYADDVPPMHGESALDDPEKLNVTVLSECHEYDGPEFTPEKFSPFAIRSVMDHLEKTEAKGLMKVPKVKEKRLNRALKLDRHGCVIPWKYTGDELKRIREGMKLNPVTEEDWKKAKAKRWNKEQ